MSHHNACDCREVYFKGLLAQAEALAEALKSIQNAYGDPHAEDDITITAREALAAYEGNNHG